MKRTFQDRHQLLTMKPRRKERAMLQRFGAGILASGIAALLIKIFDGQPWTVSTAQVMGWQNLPLFTQLDLPDPAAEEIMHQYLKDLSKQGIAKNQQGIWIQSEMSVLARHQDRVPLPGASLTKIATTLAALSQWGVSHQFETLVSATGPIKKGVLQGDLVIDGGGDPLFVWEEAIALGNSLNQMGIRQVKGNLIIMGNFSMNYEQNSVLAGQMLRQGLNSKLWNRGFAYRHAIMPKGTPKPEVAITGGIKLASFSIPKKYLLIRHRSLPLSHILKEMNVHSNNNMAEILTESLGGAKARNELAAQAANISLQELQLVNGSGLGVENQISAHAAATLMIATDRLLKPHKLTIGDVYPVSGLDKNGTMYARHMPIGSTIKTGTLRDVSALAGVLPTRDRGLIWFTIINRGSDVYGFRVKQDEFLQKLSQKWGIAPYFNRSLTEIPKQFGDPKRNEKISLSLK